MYELFIANKNYSSWSLRPWVLMRSLEIPFGERIYPFPDTEPGSAVFQKFSPSGKVPCLKDGKTTVWDSLAITEYLNERHAGVWPADTRARAFARSATAEMHSGFSALRSICSMNCGIRIKLRELPEELELELTRLRELWSEGLEEFGGPFLAGETFTAADAFFCPVAYRAQTYGLDFGARANRYVENMLALPAMQEWYRAALAETWRIARYEAHALAAGELTADKRVAPARQ